jgi:hypothetical protein
MKRTDMMRRPALIVLLVFPTLYIQAQTLNPSTDVLVWDYSKLYNDKNQEELVANGKLVSHPGQKVEWVQNDAQYTDTFVVTGVEGAWASTRLPGRVTYHIQWDGRKGTLVFSSTAAGLMAELRITHAGRKDSFFKFYINNVGKL